eukprot:TRINITY_DN10590_c0_g1_i1.p2 TRINITY_DN10590_c0_g1~~TRINITY_DN10590_c0_g1_i1.p2  ORF type:complete len:119 (-),score=33.17 TRINITY_DN10590_c0_g1_i1:89-445(-)
MAEEIAVEEEQKIEMVADHGPNATEREATFIIRDEDHTIGGPLRYMLHKNPATDFAGYTIPHPSQPKMELRIQTTRGSAAGVFQESLDRLHEVGEHILHTFIATMDEFESQPDLMADD